MSQVQAIQPDVIYPDSDGQPTADNTKQFEWIVLIKKNLDLLFDANPAVFVAGDLLWYPVQGNNTLRQAPDVMVVLGRPKGDRGFYRQWEESNLPPTVVFEILSPGNRLSNFAKKLQFYNRYGVEEYYIYDPDDGELIGWLRTETALDIIDEMAGWVSPRLGIRFEPTPEGLEIFRPDGQKFLSYTELAQQLEQAAQQLEQAEARAAQAEARAARLAEQLRALGIDPEQH